MTFIKTTRPRYPGFWNSYRNWRATLFTVLGIDPSSEFETDFGSPATAR